MPSEPPTWRDRVEHGRPDAGLVDGDRAHRGRGRRRHRQRHPDSAHERARAGCPRTSIPASSWAKRIERERDEAEPAADQPARADPVGQRPGLRCDQDDQQRHRQEDRARLDRRVAEDVLDEERVVEEDPEHRERDEQHRDVRAGEGRVAEEREVEHRQPLPELEDDERGERDHGEPRTGEDRGRRPAVVVGLDQRVGEREQAHSPTRAVPAGRDAARARCPGSRRSPSGP